MSTRPWRSKWSIVPRPFLPSTPDACASSTMTRGLVAIRDVADAGQRRDVAVHRENAVRDDQDRAVLAVRAALVARVAQDLVQAVDVAMREDRARRLGHAHAVDDRGVIELITDDQVVLAGDCRDRAAVGGQARLKRQHRLDVLEVGEPALELLEQARVAGDRAHGARADAEVADGLVRPPRRRCGCVVRPR